MAFLAASARARDVESPIVSECAETTGSLDMASEHHGLESTGHYGQELGGSVSAMMVVFAGGEPTLHREKRSSRPRSKSLGMTTSIVTNGRSLPSTNTRMPLMGWPRGRLSR